MTNPFRRRVAASLLMRGEARPAGRAEVTDKATFGHTTWLGIGCSEGRAGKRRDLPRVRACGRSQSPHGTAGARSPEKRGQQSRAEGRRGRKVDVGSTVMRQGTAPPVPDRAKQGAEARDWSWVEASVWTDRMVSALDKGVKGGRWYSLMDKVGAPATLGGA
jgi:hypothetical protein